MLETKRQYRDLEKIKYLDKAEVERLLKIASRSIRDYAILTVSYNHGLRILECELLKLNDWNGESNRLHITRVKNGISAGYKVCDDVAKALKNWIKIRGDEPGPLFLSVRAHGKSIIGNKREERREVGIGITTSGLDQLFRKYAKKANLPKDKCHFHTLRHSIAVELVNKDVPIMQIKDWLGHRNISSTMVYAQVSDKKRDETAERLGNIVGEVMNGSKGSNSKNNWRKKDTRGYL